MSKVINDKQLQAQIDALASDIKPERDLWAGIERAIEHQQHTQTDSGTGTKRATFTPYAWAASVVLAVVMTWSLNMPSPTAPVQLTALDVLQQQYMQEKDTMLVSFGKPDIKKLPEAIQKQFAELQSARKSLLTALDDDPDNADLLNLLKWTQSQELSLLEQLYSPKWQTI